MFGRTENQEISRCISHMRCLDLNVLYTTLVFYSRLVLREKERCDTGLGGGYCRRKIRGEGFFGRWNFVRACGKGGKPG